MTNQVTYKGLGRNRREFKSLSTASQVLTLDDQNYTLMVPGGLNGQIYSLPQITDVGLEFEFVFESDADTAENIIRNTSDASGGVDDFSVGGTTGKGVSAASTSEGGEWIRLLSVTPTRWLVMGGQAPWVAAAAT